MIPMRRETLTYTHTSSALDARARAFLAEERRGRADVLALLRDPVARTLARRVGRKFAEGFRTGRTTLKSLSPLSIATRAEALDAFARSEIPHWYDCGRQDGMGYQQDQARDGARLLRAVLRVLERERTAPT